MCFDRTCEQDAKDKWNNSKGQGKHAQGDPPFLDKGYFSFFSVHVSTIENAGQFPAMPFSKNIRKSLPDFVLTTKTGLNAKIRAKIELSKML
jgi:hypothetical protein